MFEEILYKISEVSNQACLFLSAAVVIIMIIVSSFGYLILGHLLAIAAIILLSLTVISYMYISSFSYSDNYKYRTLFEKYVILIYEEGAFWKAECNDLNLVTMGHTEEEAIIAMQKAMKDYSSNGGKEKSMILFLLLTVSVYLFSVLGIAILILYLFSATRDDIIFTSIIGTAYLFLIIVLELLNEIIRVKTII
jgi:hypothetical protein